MLNVQKIQFESIMETEKLYLVVHKVAPNKNHVFDDIPSAEEALKVVRQLIEDGADPSTIRVEKESTSILEFSFEAEPK